MKRITAIIVMGLLVSGLFAQYQQQSRLVDEKQGMRTLFGPDVSNGGYGALSVGYTQLNGRNGLMMGGRAAWVIGHSLAIGAGGFGIVSEPEYDPVEDLNYTLAGGYGGVIVEPIILGRWPVHIAVPVLLGAGGVALTSYSSDFPLNDEPFDTYYEDASVFLVAEPGVELELNLVQFIRLSFYGSYRFTSDLFMQEVSGNALIGWSAGITLKVGSF